MTWATHDDRRLHRFEPDSDVVELSTVGIDVGSATFHLTVSRVVLERRAQELSSRYDVVAREAVVTSPVCFTPYLASGEIDAPAVDAAVRGFYAEGAVDPQEIDTGVVLLTGSALLRRNARPLAERLAGTTGRFVCAAAGHHFEAVLAAHGSGAVARSRRTTDLIVALDIGGATTKLALVCDGEVQATAAVGVGGRLLAWNGAGRVVRVEEAVMPFARAAGVVPEPGLVVSRAQIDAICDGMALAVVVQLDPQLRSRLVPAGVADKGVVTALLTGPFPVPDGPYEIVASGGVAEYFDSMSGQAEAHDDEVADDHGDLGPHLARALLTRLQEAGLSARLRRGEQRIRATVIGASQFSTQVSGSTVSVDVGVLPLHNVPVVRPDLDLGARTDLDLDLMASSVASAVEARFSVENVPDKLAVSLRWGGDPSYTRLRAVAAGLVAGQRRAGVETLVVAVDTDVAWSLGRIMATELRVASGRVLCLDGLELADLDYVDVGQPVQPAKVVPIVVKSLLFGAAGTFPTEGAEPRSDRRSTLEIERAEPQVENEGDPT